MVALTGSDLTGTTARVRAKRPDGSWGPWYRRRRHGSNSDDSHGGGTRGTDPVFVGTTTAVQIAVTRPDGRTRHHRAAETRPRRRPGTGLRPGERRTRPRAEHVRGADHAHRRRPSTPSGRRRRPTLGPGQPPNIISRAQWGAGTPACAAVDRCTAVEFARRWCTTPRPVMTTRREDSAAIIRSIYAYHTMTLGWCDIAYNALVDKYGQVFEGRGGGITKDVLGSHTGGFNRDVWGVSLIGDFEDSCRHRTSWCKTSGRLLGWRMSLDRVNPLDTVQLKSAGGNYTVVPGGQFRDTAGDLRPPRCRQHRMPGQSRICGPGRDPIHRSAVSTVRPT